LFEEHENGATLEELAKKYGYSSYKRVEEYIRVYKNRDKILEAIPDASGSPIGIYKALKILRELKKQEKVEAEQPFTFLMRHNRHIIYVCRYIINIKLKF